MIKQETRSLWQGYKLHVEQLNPILERMSERGIPVNKSRLDAFGDELDVMKEETYGKLAALYPVELLLPKQKEGLKKTPKIIESLWATHIDALKAIPRDTSCGIELAEYDKVFAEVYEKTGYLCKQFPTGEVRFYLAKPFKPSNKQLKLYIQAKGHKIPTRAVKKGEPGSAGRREKQTTDKTALEQLYKATGDVFYLLCVKYRNFEKLRGTYVKGWQPAQDGRVHCSYLFRPATGQLSSVSPNVHNAIGEKAGELGVRFKGCIEARPGRRLVEFDFIGLHSFMLGFLANDPSYMRLSRLGVHDFVAAHVLKRELPRLLEETKNVKKHAAIKKAGLLPDRAWLEHLASCVVDVDRWLDRSDVDLAVALTRVKELVRVYRNKIKPAVHGYGFGVGAFKLFKEYPDSFNSIKEAQAIIDMLNGLFPLVATWREQIKEQAQQQSYLLSPFGTIRYFYNVFDIRPVSPSYEFKWHEKKVLGRNGKVYKKVAGMDAEKAIAFLPATNSFGYKKDVMLEIARLGLDDRFCLINEVHDSLLFEPLAGEVGDCIEIVLGLMHRPNPCLVSELAPNGLVCRATASVGSDWGGMKEIAA